jgi:putative Ca2+/H+ antiporter (TMEM165/GDT1 family)
MDWKLLGSTFVAVFIAELGDKTQLATLSLAAGSGAGTRWIVFCGAALALIATSALAVLGGELVARFVSPLWLHRIAGVVFVALGALYLFRGGPG